MKKNKKFTFLGLLLVGILIIPSICPLSDVFGVHTTDTCSEIHEVEAVAGGPGGSWFD